MGKQYLGVKDGRLAECPNSPNCVSTQTDQSDKQMEPLPFHGDLNSTKETLKKVLQEMERTKVEIEEEHYIHALVITKLLRFKDDVEFYLDESSQQVHFRSASRTGYSDMGVNRKRMKAFTEAYYGYVEKEASS
ncbi:DUF1499 domain-containing protein [Halobacillus halophilus]|uniref:DUF1499 domain-containing protein n=1 Tax=Halobacillus halophilus TaxID=1570 RepID=UPI001CD51833|nr:DUF1499 domain-containing protein [Halobacillus halophilus]MCA1012167.1 DUF1499 domain-containing protein [Halobacillus halophilus]